MTESGVLPVRMVRHVALLAAALSFAVLLVACQAAPNPPQTSPVVDEYLAGPSGETIDISYTFPGDDESTQIKAELYDGMVLIEGDIALGTFEEITAVAAHLGSQSHAISTATGYWPATSSSPYVYEVPYVISDDFSESYATDTIGGAIEHWNANTNLELVERTSEADYIEFVSADNRCWSEAGRKGGRQEIRLDEGGCTQIATVVHEIGHAIGLKHEQQRSDRDDFIEILTDNVDPDKIGNFNIYWPGLPLGPYGYTSVMHYSSTAFGLVDDDGNKLTTISTLGAPIAPAARLTDGDLAAIRRIYPERDAPFAEITRPAQTLNVDEGTRVRFEADVVIDPTIDDSDLLLSWTYDNNLGVPFTFASGGQAEAAAHRFCDGVHDVTMSALLPGHGVVATDTVRVTVNDLGMSGPPAMCAVSIDIDEPLDGAVYVEGATISLAAVIDDDHPETDDPLYPVLWRLDDPQNGGIVGTTLLSSTKLGAGQHTLYATYGSASDSVTITVVEAGTPPSASIDSPADESVHSWFELGEPSESFLDIEFTSSASDSEDGTLTGSSLVWEVRHEGTGTYVERGTGANPTLRFQMEAGLVGYDVRLTATDSDGMTNSVVIQIGILWPPS